MSLKTMGQSEENRWRSAVSAGRVLFSIQKTTCRLSENSGKRGVKVWDMVSLSHICTSRLIQSNPEETPF